MQAAAGLYVHDQHTSNTSSFLFRVLLRNDDHFVEKHGEFYIVNMNGYVMNIWNSI